METFTRTYTQTLTSVANSTLDYSFPPRCQQARSRGVGLRRFRSSEQLSVVDSNVGDGQLGVCDESTMQGGMLDNGAVDDSAQDTLGASRAGGATGHRAVSVELGDQEGDKGGMEEGDKGGMEEGVHQGSEEADKEGGGAEEDEDDQHDPPPPPQEPAPVPAPKIAVPPIPVAPLPAPAQLGAPIAAALPPPPPALAAHPPPPPPALAAPAVVPPPPTALPRPTPLIIEFAALLGDQRLERSLSDPRPRVTRAVYDRWIAFVNIHRLRAGPDDLARLALLAEQKFPAEKGHEGLFLWLATGYPVEPPARKGTNGKGRNRIYWHRSTLNK